MLVILCGLGFWQVQRLQWKTALLGRIDAAERSAGVPLSGTPAAFQKVRASGRLLPEIARYGVEVRDTAGGEVLGSRVVGILERAAGLPVVTVLGWLPDGVAYVPPSGQVTIAGYARAPVRPGWFTPANDPVARRFYALNPDVIGAALGVARVAPFTLVAMGARLGPAAPVPDTAMPRPPNDHLQYAITWFGLAAVLVVIFGAYLRKTVRA